MQLNNFKSVKPIVKWNGGKSQLLPLLREHLPKDYNNFVDPFFGGGAFPFDSARPETLIINDINGHLIAMYKAVREDYQRVILELNGLDSLYKGKDAFYIVRGMYNKNSDSDQYKRAAMFIYLNKRCFNGLYRVNKRGEFNVSSNGRRAATHNADEMRETSQYLRNVDAGRIHNTDYKNVLEHIKTNDFVFLDPPYIEDGHDETERLYGGAGIDYNEFADFLKEIDRRGARFLMTNNATNDVKKRFIMFNIIETGEVKRYFRPNGNDRKGHEVIIKNY